MKIHTLHLGDLQNPLPFVALDERELQHAKVLRIREGHQVRWVSFGGYFGSGIFRNQGIEIVDQAKESAIRTIYIGVPDKNSQKDCVENAIASGFGQIIFVRTKFSDIHRLNIEKLYLNAASAQKQSGFPGPVSISEIPFEKLPFDQLVAMDISGGLVKDLLPEIDLHQDSFLIGPPGGLSEEELSGVRRKVKIEGPILRSELAVVAAGSLFNLLKSFKS